jgi:hypothetical protein
MKSRSEIVAGGGWIKNQTTGKPRARFFTFLSVIWLGVSICASFPFWNGWPHSFGYVEWLCGALLVLQPVFALLAVIFFVTERPQIITEQQNNPDCDIQKLN